MMMCAQYFYIDEINDYLYSLEYILDSAYIKQDEVVVIALRLKPIYLKSQKDELIKSIQDYFFEKLDAKEVIITLDSDLFYKIKNANTIEEKIYSIKLARERL